MKEVTVQNNQSIWDLAVQHLGHADGAKLLIVWNPLVCDFNKNTPAGTKIKIDESQIIDQSVVNYIRNKGISCASSSKTSNWILDSGFWNDGGTWEDLENWKD